MGICSQIEGNRRSLKEREGGGGWDSNKIVFGVVHMFKVVNRVEEGQSVTGNTLTRSPCLINSPSDWHEQ